MKTLKVIVLLVLAWATTSSLMAQLEPTPPWPSPYLQVNGDREMMTSVAPDETLTIEVVGYANLFYDCDLFLEWIMPPYPLTQTDASSPGGGAITGVLPPEQYQLTMQLSTFDGVHFILEFAYDNPQPFPVEFAVHLMGFYDDGTNGGGLDDFLMVRLESGTSSPAATQPVPANGSLLVPVDTWLDWTVGPGAQSHEVYIATDPFALIIPLATGVNPPVDLGNPLDYNTTYYWRVDAMDEFGTLYEGPVWQFITVAAANLPPVVSIAAVPISGPAPLAVSFSSAGTYDPEGDPLAYEWDFGDGETSTQANPAHTYSVPGDYAVVLSVSDGQNESVALLTILATSANQSPVADAGDNLQIAGADQAGAIVQGLALDPDEDLLQYRWLEGATVLLDWTDGGPAGEAYLDLGDLPCFSIGNHTLTLEVSDGILTASDEMILTVDNSPPQSQPAPSTQVVQIGDPIVIVADVADFDGDTLSYDWLKDDQLLAFGSVETLPGGDTVPIPSLDIPPGDARFPVGTHSVELRVSDGINTPVSQSVSVTVTDTTAPSLSLVPSDTILWPPNHKMRAVTIQANVSDNGGGAITLSVQVVSSEPADDTGDGSTETDYEVVSINNETGLIELNLRAERAGTGNGRTYTILVTAADESGNQSVAVAEISAPHDKRKK